MSTLRRTIALLLLAIFVGTSAPSAQAQRRRQQQRRPTAARTPGVPPTAADSRLTGVYSLDTGSSDDPQEAAERAAGDLAFDVGSPEAERLIRRLSSPAQLAIERRGNTISIASTRAQRITFEADGRERIERTPRGNEVRSRAVLYNEELMVSYSDGGRDEFSVTFDPIDQGRRLRVTRRIFDRRLARPVVVQSIYERVSSVARWNIYGGPDSAQVAARQPAREQTQLPRGVGADSMTQLPPTIRTPVPTPMPPAERRDAGPFIGVDTQFVAVLNNNLTTRDTRPGDTFTLTVREPRAFEGATIEGYVSRVSPGGRISGRSEIDLAFERLVLRDGRSLQISGYIESVQPQGGERVRVNNEGGGVGEQDNQANRTMQRTAIGAAVGAVIGAIADEGRGAAIGAAIGAAAGAGSVYAQGRGELELRSGTEMIIRASVRE